MATMRPTIYIQPKRLTLPEVGELFEFEVRVRDFADEISAFSIEISGNSVVYSSAVLNTDLVPDMDVRILEGPTNNRIIIRSTPEPFRGRATSISNIPARSGPRINPPIPDGDYLIATVTYRVVEKRETSILGNGYILDNDDNVYSESHERLYLKVLAPEASRQLARNVYDNYRFLLQREDIIAVLPSVLDALNTDDVQSVLSDNPAIVSIVLESPSILASFGVDLDEDFIALLENDQAVRELLFDPLVQKLLGDGGAIDTLIGLITDDNLTPEPDPTETAYTVTTDETLSLTRIYVTGDVTRIEPGAIQIASDGSVPIYNFALGFGDAAETQKIKALLPEQRQITITEGSNTATYEIQSYRLLENIYPSDIVYIESRRLVSGTVFEPTVGDSLTLTFSTDAPSAPPTPETVLSGAPLANRVFEKYQTLLLRSDIAPDLPLLLRRLTQADAQRALNRNPNIIFLLLYDDEAVFVAFGITVNQSLTTAIQSDAAVRAMIEDAITLKLLTDIAALNTLATLIENNPAYTAPAPDAEPAITTTDPPPLEITREATDGTIENIETDQVIVDTNPEIPLNILTIGLGEDDAAEKTVIPLGEEITLTEGENSFTIEVGDTTLIEHVFDADVIQVEGGAATDGEVFQPATGSEVGIAVSQTPVAPSPSVPIVGTPIVGSRASVRFQNVVSRGPDGPYDPVGNPVDRNISPSGQSRPRRRHKPAWETR